jgi:hypothetical protein
MSVDNSHHHATSAPRVVPQSNVLNEQGTVRIPVRRDLGEPQVHIAREGDRIAHIDVVCRCGNRLRLVCEYEERKT